MTFESRLLEAERERYLPLPCPLCGRFRLLYSPTVASVDSLMCEKCGVNANILSAQIAMLREAARATSRRLRWLAELTADGANVSDALVTASKAVYRAW